MRRRRWIVLVVGALLAATACAAGEPRASNEVPAPATVDPAPIVWAALGGDETLTSGPEAAETSWVRAVLDELPESAELLVVATPAASVADALDVQLPALAASPRPPTVATVWLGSGERGTSPERFEDELTELVVRLRELGVGRVVLVSRPDAPTEQGGRFAGVIAAVAEATGADHVPVDGVDGSPREPAARARVAAALAPAVRGG